MLLLIAEFLSILQHYFSRMLKPTEKIHLIHLDNVDSTNNYVANLFRMNEIIGGTVVSADYQSDGRGQRATKWQSRSSQNALFSLFLAWESFPNSFQFLISMLTAIAIQEVLEKKINKTVHIKWPNDIHVDGHKIAGVLIENNLISTQVTSSIIGIGLNVNQSIFPTDLKATSLLLETGQVHDCKEVTMTITNTLVAKCNGIQFVENSFNAIKEIYLSKTVNFNAPSKVYDQLLRQYATITPLDIARSGQLIAQDDKGSLRFYDVKDLLWNV